MSDSSWRDASGRLVDRSPFTVLIAAISFVLLAYSVARAATVPLTYDEAVTFQWYIDTDPLSVMDLSSATNHLLNTLLTRVAFSVGGDREVVLRAPSLIGHALYLLFSFLILHGIRYRAVAAGGFLLLNLNPYLFDYFSLCRGYGLALGLLMGALYFLVRMITCGAEALDGRRHLARALLLGGAAVAANTSLLLLYLALWSMGFVILMAWRRRKDRRERPTRSVRLGMRTIWRWATLPLVAALFTGIAFAQDESLSSSLYEPVSVRIVGLFDYELDTISVQRLDTTLRWRPLPREGDTWRTERAGPVGALRVELPSHTARNFALIAATIGPKTFRHERRSPGPWAMRDTGRMVVLESDPTLALPRATVPALRRAINWRGEERQVRVVALAVGVVLIMLGLLAAALSAAGWLLTRLEVLDAASWRVLTRGILWMAVILGCPLYMQSRNAMFYFGGRRGLVPDTYASLVGSSFYGVTYHPAQTSIVLAGMGVSVVTFVVFVLVWLRRRPDSTLLAAGVMLALFAIASVLAILQHVLLGTPYLMGRTALFLIPLYGLFFALLCAAIAATHWWGRVLVASSFAVLVPLAAFHFATTANLTHTLDWPKDADTRQMIADVQRAVASGPEPATLIRLGVQSDYYPVASFYARRATPASIAIGVLPAETPVDYLYVGGGSGNEKGHVIVNYPRSQSALMKAERPDQPVPTLRSR